MRLTEVLGRNWQRKNRTFSRQRISFPWAVVLLRLTQIYWHWWNNCLLWAQNEEQRSNKMLLGLTNSHLPSFAIFFDMAISSLTHPPGLKCIVVNRRWNSLNFNIVFLSHIRIPPLFHLHTLACLSLAKVTFYFNVDSFTLCIFPIKYKCGSFLKRKYCKLHRVFQSFELK